MRSGLVLIELLFVVVLLGLLALFAVPRLSDVADAAAVRDEAMRVVAALDAARGAAIRLGTVATLTLSDTSYRVSRDGRRRHPDRLAAARTRRGNGVVAQRRRPARRSSVRRGWQWECRIGPSS